MNDLQWAEYQNLNDQMDICKQCHVSQFADSNSIAPGRPYLRPRENPILFIGEAPPSQGGFWRLGNQDFVRNRVIGSVLNTSRKTQLDFDSEDAIRYFVGAGFYFVQALKWPFKKGVSYKSLPRALAHLAIEHSVKAHLERELVLIQPIAVICLGAAAWDSCSLLPGNDFKPLRSGDLKFHRLKHHKLILAHGTIAMHLTYLPVKRSKGRTEVMQADVPVFLECITNDASCEVANRVRFPSAGKGRTFYNS